ncbi:MAG: hypothetical protein GF317_01110 [Candidatus Lokiarchaeota archaeon]|nr:hypothetical protein [Candidatus Lokiarchaeota archaeon]MBD3198558.1 hypothetical protein [Candidatus Lokiarchaeota archaeon]
MIMQTSVGLILFLTPSVLLIISIGFFIYFLRKTIQTKQRMYLYLTILYLIHILSHFFQTAQYAAPELIGAQVNFILHQITRMVILYLLVLILEFFGQNVLFTGKATLITVFAFLSIGGMISTPNLTYEMIETRFIVFFDELSPVIIFQLLFEFTASIWMIYQLRNYKKAAVNSKQKGIIKILFIGFILAILVPTIPNLILELFGQPPRASIIIFLNLIVILENIGILMIGGAFLRVGNNRWLLQQQKVYLIVVYSPDGIELYSKAFSKNISKDDVLLLAGGFSAVTNLFREVTDAEGSIKSILLEDKELRIIKRENFISALLVDYSTQATEEAHKQFSLKFEEEFKGELRDFAGEVSVFSAADEISEKLFF